MLMSTYPRRLIGAIMPIRGRIVYAITLEFDALVSIMYISH